MSRPRGSPPGALLLLLPLHHKPGKPRRFQLLQHPVGVGAVGEGSHLDPIQGIALSRLGGLGGGDLNPSANQLNILILPVFHLGVCIFVCNMGMIAA